MTGPRRRTIAGHPMGGPQQRTVVWSPTKVGTLAPMSSAAIGNTNRTSLATSLRGMRLTGVTMQLIPSDISFRRVLEMPTRAWQLVSYERRLAMMNLVAVVVAFAVVSALTALFFGRGLEMLTVQAADVIDQSGVSATTSTTSNAPAETTATAPVVVVEDAPWDPYAPALPAAVAE